MTANAERLYRAVSVLVGPGTIQERLADAFRDQIQYLDPGTLSDMAVVELARIKDQLTAAEPSGDLDSIDMSARALSEADAEELAIEVLDMYDQALRGAA